MEPGQSPRLPATEERDQIGTRVQLTHAFREPDCAKCFTRSCTSFSRKTREVDHAGLGVESRA